MVSGVRSLGLAATLLLLACSTAAAAVQPSSHPYVKVSLAAAYTKAQRLAIQNGLSRNPAVRSVELLTRSKQLATARRLYRSILPPDDLPAAISALQQKTKNDVICVRVGSNAAADRLFSTYNVKRPGVASITKFSGGEMLSDCSLVNGLEHTRLSVEIAPPTQR